jgi:hypothetical protein
MGKGVVHWTFSLILQTMAQLNTGAFPTVKKGSRNPITQTKKLQLRSELPSCTPYPLDAPFVVIPLELWL